jgi:deferrochelatase/peroxidase EfeB
MTGCPFASRRGFLAGGLAGGLAAGLAGVARAAPQGDVPRDAPPADAAAKGITAASQGPGRQESVPFRGARQAGILTPLQSHTYFAAFDLTTTRQAEVAALLARWTLAAEHMARGEAAQPDSPAPAPDPGADPAIPPRPRPAGDSGEAFGLAPARLSVTFGFGAGLFVRDGQDRYGLASRRPEALVDLPRFNGDQMQEARTGGDLSVQACADDPQVAFHAVRQLARIAGGVAVLRWVQSGFSANFAANDTPRNLMGFKDGTQNPLSRRPEESVGGAVRPATKDAVWVGEDGPAWMRGGSYLVVRRIRVALEHWDATDTEFQEQVMGRHKVSGAPLGGTSEFDPLDLDAVDADGNSVIPDTAHVRLAAAASNGGADMLRRGYSYNDGVNMVAERWPPWRQGLEYDSGLLFICYQRDPRAGFIPVFEQMSRLDMLNQYVTHTGGGLFACPGGAQGNGFIGQGLFEA